MMKCLVYVLESQKDGRLYIGILKDVSKRIGYHNRGRVRSTKSRRPFQLVGHKKFASLAEAREMEVALKRMKDPARVRAWVLA